jgi:hypothetical protein
VFVLLCFNLVQRVVGATYDDGNTLDLLITREPLSDLIANVVADGVCSSDYRLVKCIISVRTQQAPVVIYEFRDVINMDVTSKVFQSAARQLSAEALCLFNDEIFESPGPSFTIDSAN